MFNNTVRSSTLCLSTAALFASLDAGCVTDPSAAPADENEALQETEQLGTVAGGVTPLPSFTSTPNIRQAVSTLANPSVLAVIKTISGFQIYRCEQGATAPEWKLRTPLAGFEPAANVQCPSVNRTRLASLVGGYHYRSDFGMLLADSQLQSIGLAAPTTAPVWDFTFQPAGQPARHEVVAGRVLAQDAPSAANIPLLLIEVRGRSVDAGTPTVIASSTHMLRWNTANGLAPAASTCTAATLGREVQSPYAAEYYFLKTTP
jgi:hypothetical protein